MRIHINDKRRIKAEEIYRTEVQNELATHKKTSGSRLEGMIRFFNSAFGIWLLSSVILALLSWSFSQWQTNRETERNHQERIRKLDLEIANRLDPTQLKTRAMYDNTFEHQLPKKVFLPPSQEDVLFAEFATWNMKSLLIELWGLLPENSADKVNVQVALHELFLLQSEFGSKDLDKEQVDKFYSGIGRIYRRRWDPTAGFEYTEEMKEQIESMFNSSDQSK